MILLYVSQRFADHPRIDARVKLAHSCNLGFEWIPRSYELEEIWQVTRNSVSATADCIPDSQCVQPKEYYVQRHITNDSFHHHTYHSLMSHELISGVRRYMLVESLRIAECSLFCAVTVYQCFAFNLLVSLLMLVGHSFMQRVYCTRENNFFF